ncbi:hypothetical protein BGZ91_005688 [Linnemannia elongata]|nr:hypothetical protein BGZ91_005688 [Linnemannia elongata]
MQNQHPFPQHPHAHPQQMPHHSEPWMSQAAGPNPGFPPFHGNIPVPQHPPQGVPPPPFLHQPNPYPQAPTFQNHQQPAPFQQPHFSHPPRNVPVVVPTPALAPPPPEPTHRDVLTRELHAGQMISKIEADADYYEPLPAYVSVPFKKKAHQDKDLLDSVAQLVQETEAIKAEDLAKGDEGWHEGQLNEFYRNHGGKRKEAFSENPRRRAVRGHRHRQEDVILDQDPGRIQEVDPGAVHPSIIVRVGGKAKIEALVGAGAGIEEGPLVAAVVGAEAGVEVGAGV